MVLRVFEEVKPIPRAAVIGRVRLEAPVEEHFRPHGLDLVAIAQLQKIAIQQFADGRLRKGLRRDGYMVRLGLGGFGGFGGLSRRASSNGCQHHHH